MGAEERAGGLWVHAAAQELVGLAVVALWEVVDGVEEALVVVEEEEEAVVLVEEEDVVAEAVLRQGQNTSSTILIFFSILFTALGLLRYVKHLFLAS